MPVKSKGAVAKLPEEKRKAAEKVPPPPAVEEEEEDPSDDEASQLLADEGVQLLISPMLEASFIEEFWEKKPCMLKATSDRKAFFTGAGQFDFESLASVAKEREEEDEVSGLSEEEETIRASPFLDACKLL